MTPASVRPPITRSGAQADARRELAKGIYHRDQQSLVTRVLHAVSHFINHVFDRFSDGGGFASGGVVAILVVLAVALVLLFWRVGAPRRTARVGAILATSSIRSAADHRAAAVRAAAEGDCHTAIVERMRAIARQLEESGALDPRPGRTATELAREARAVLPDQTAGLTAATDTFNAVAYGGAAADFARLDLLVAADDAIRSASRSRVRAQ